MNQKVEELVLKIKELETELKQKKAELQKIQKTCDHTFVDRKSATDVFEHFSVPMQECTICNAERRKP